MKKNSTMKMNATTKTIISILTFIGIILLALFFDYSRSSSYKKEKLVKEENAAIVKLTESVQKALDEQDFASAYKEVDAVLNDHHHTYVRDTGHSLNEKILSQEIVSLIDTDEDGNNAPRIIYAISDRAKYNDFWSVNDSERGKKEEIKMYKTAIRTSEASEKDQLTKKLKKALELLQKEE